MSCFLPRIPLTSLSSLPKSKSTTLLSASISMSTLNSTQEEEEAAAAAISYHNRTKHSLSKGYARGPHNLDWANQPNPFLSLSSSSSPLLHLLDPLFSSPPYPSLFLSPPSHHPLPPSSLSSLLFDSLSLSAWKSSALSVWSLRVNPSSGNLHPTETHLILPPLPPLSSSPSPSVLHYLPKSHSLETLTRDVPPSIFPNSPSCFFLAFSSVFWREAWKYGERALRYCNHDVGHAIGAVVISAASLGWDSKLVDGLGHVEIQKLLGLEKLYEKMPDVESQHPDCLLALFPFGSKPGVDPFKIREALEGCDSWNWVGSPNPLSKDHVCWDVIYETAEVIKKPFTGEGIFDVDPFRKSGSISEDLYEDCTVREIVRKRRSAVDMDGVHIMKRDVFYQMMLRCLPSGELSAGERQGRQMALPFRVLSWDAEVHATLFVHRVEGLSRGLYFLVRNEEHFDGLRRAMRDDFEWGKPEGCPEGLPLYRLAKGNCERIAKLLSCHQDIASNGCFSLGMVARFEPVLREKGAWMYPRLFWECGVLGQLLYLEAHAIGISATGIGCYFDDDVHEVLGLKDSEFQSLYHFTIGKPVLDKRIMSLPAYPGPGLDA